MQYGPKQERREECALSQDSPFFAAEPYNLGKIVNTSENYTAWMWRKVLNWLDSKVFSDTIL